MQVQDETRHSGKVDGGDYVVWRKSQGTGTQYTKGDANLDGIVNGADYGIWRGNFGFTRQPLTPGAGNGAATTAAPEPSTFLLISIASMFFRLTTIARRARWVGIARRVTTSK